MSESTPHASPSQRGELSEQQEGVFDLSLDLLCLASLIPILLRVIAMSGAKTLKQKP